MKPSVQDLDAWEKLGNPGWGWEALSPYYRKAEKYVLVYFSAKHCAYHALMEA